MRLYKPYIEGSIVRCNERTIEGSYTALIYRPTYTTYKVTLQIERIDSTIADSR